VQTRLPVASVSQNIVRLRQGFKRCIALFRLISQSLESQAVN
jgi:hypothetical protein